MRWTDKKVIVVGASSGIGREIALQLAANGSRVMAVARRENLLQDLAHAAPSIQYLVHDVTDFGTASAAFDQACKELGGLDAIFYCSGELGIVEPGEYDTSKDISMMEVNALGAIAWLNPAAERFAAVGHGIIVGIGSVAGVRGRAGQPAYNASKSALHSYLESLRNRLFNKKVKVTTIVAGPIKTAMTAHLDKPMMSAHDAAEKIIRLAPTGSERCLKWSHAIVCGILRIIPSFIFRRLPL